MESYELKVLLEAAAALNIDPSEIKPCNPFEMRGSRAELLQSAVASISPGQAATWRQAAGDGVSLEVAAVKAGVIENNARVHQTLMETDPKYLQEVQQNQKDREAALLQSMDAAADELRGRKLDETPQARNRWSDWQAGIDVLKAAELKARQQ